MMIDRAWHVVGAYLDAAAEHWLGWTFPPVSHAIEAARWTPDERSEYCGRCGDSVGPGEATDSGCSTCRSGAELSGGIADGVVRLGAHIDSLREWVAKIKYERWAEMGDQLGRMLGERVRHAGVVELDQTLVVPMPMPWQRRMYRGIDHTRVIANGVASQLGLPVARLLAKSNHPPQVRLAPSERRRSGSHGLRLRYQFGGWGRGGETPLEGIHLLLVDDVRTTGASLKAAARLLSKSGPERIACAVLSVSDSKARRTRGTGPPTSVGGQ